MTEENLKDLIKNAKRIVVKIGSSLLTNEGQSLCEKKIYAWAAEISNFFEADKEVILVSSGAIAAGLSLLKLDERPTEVAKLQALAGIGQMQLVETWRKAFAVQGLLSAQVLLTHSDLSNRTRYLNAKNALETLLHYKAIPIINENDTVATEEIKLGDNDTLGAMVANLLEADLLILLTDQDGLFTKDPRTNPDAQLIKIASATDANLLNLAGDAGKFGRGGMRTKILAAAIAAKSGTATAIANGKHSNSLTRIISGELEGSFLLSEFAKVTARKRWILGLATKGELVVDAGAQKAILEKGKSLLPVGIAQVKGNFLRGDAVAIISSSGEKIATGISNYTKAEMQSIKGKSLEQIEKEDNILQAKEAIHRDNLVLLNFDD